MSPARVKPFAVDVGITIGVGELLRELDPTGAFVDGPAAGVDDFVRAELAIGGFVWLAQRAYADFYEGLAGFGFFIAEGLEFFDGARDGVIDFGVVVSLIGGIEPFAEVGVSVGFEAGDYAGPVEAGGLIVALAGVGQVDFGVDGFVGDFDLRWGAGLRCGVTGSRRRVASREVVRGFRRQASAFHIAVQIVSEWRPGTGVGVLWVRDQSSQTTLRRLYVRGH